MQYVTIIENDPIPSGWHGADTIEKVIRTTHVAGLRRVLPVKRIDRQSTRVSKEACHFFGRARRLVKTRSPKSRIFEKVKNGGLNRVASIQRSQIAVAHALVRSQHVRCKRDQR